jgi:hypothetical protein
VLLSRLVIVNLYLPNCVRRLPRHSHNLKISSATKGAIKGVWHHTLIRAKIVPENKSSPAILVERHDVAPVLDARNRGDVLVP